MGIVILPGPMEVDETHKTETRVDHHICGLVQLLQTEDSAEETTGI